MTRRFALALDQGGSFLDIIAAPLHDAGEPARIAKRSRAEDIADALPAFLADHAIAPAEVATIRIATTLPANALLTGEASPVALITTAGFTDLPDLGRQSRRDPDDPDPPPPTPPWLSPPGWRFGLPGRIAPDGSEAEPLDEAALRAIVAALPAGVPVAVCLLFAHRNPAHELRVLEALPHATLSHRVDRAPREFERMLTTLAAASLAPLLKRSLGSLAGRLAGAGLPPPCFGTAEGGQADAAEALAAPLALALSGPAAGARAVARWAGDAPSAIGLDMGGTTAEISLVRHGAPLTTREVRLGPMTLRVPALDVESIALGGDRPLPEGGPTLADAARGEGWLPGQGVASPGTLAVAEAVLAEALRRIALRRNIHPDLSLLVAGGGFGPLFAAGVAERIGCPRVLVPPSPGVLSASGLLDAAPRLAATWRARGEGLRDDGTATLRIPPGWRAAPRADGALLLERGA
ncbi:MAG: hydantoinase/oxoprolinase family protein [Acetobacteraceae bacterium]